MESLPRVDRVQGSPLTGYLLSKREGPRRNSRYVRVRWVSELAEEKYRGGKVVNNPRPGAEQSAAPQLPPHPAAPVDAVGVIRARAKGHTPRAGGYGWTLAVRLRLLRGPVGERVGRTGE